MANTAHSIGSDNPHPRRSELTSLPADSIHLQAYRFAELIRDLPIDPAIGLALRGIVVGSFPLDPGSAKDLDFEVQNITWEHLQRSFAEKHGQLGIAQIDLTRGGADGIIRPARGDLGNAFVAVWIVLDNGRRVNLSIPLRVSEGTVRYDLNSVERDPLLSFAEASRRRNFAHKALGYDPLNGERGEILDPHSGLSCIARGELVVVGSAGFRNDPLNLYAAIREMGRLEMKPSAETRSLLLEMGQADLPIGPAAIRRDRLAYDRALLLIGASRPSVLLNYFADLRALKRDFPALHQARTVLNSTTRSQPEWTAALEGLDEAWTVARGQAGWSDADRLALAAARLGFELELAVSRAGRVVSFEEIVAPFIAAMEGVTSEELGRKIADSYQALQSA